MNGESAREVARALLEARRRRRPVEHRPEGGWPRDEQEAYAIQDAFVALSGVDPVGYKIGATSETAQRFLGLDRPFAGRILGAGVHQSPARLRGGDLIFRVIEPEFAFRMATPLPPRAAAYGRDEVAEAVATLVPAIEVVTSAYGSAWTEVGGAALIADNGAHGAFVVGVEESAWRRIDLESHAVSLEVNGKDAGAGVGANALGSPLTALAWLANHLSGRGRGLEAGELVTTGVVTPFVELFPGDEAVADFGALGQVRLRFDLD